MNAKTIFQGMQDLLIRRYMGPFWYRKRWLNKTQWLSKEELSDLQFSLLKRTIRHAERHVLYYQQLMKNRGFSSEDICSVEDIKLFPVLTKEDVLKAGNTMLSQTLPRFLLRHAYTGGTTGTPMDIYRSLFSIGNEHAFVRRQWDWAGIKMSDRTTYLTGRIIVPPDQTKGKLFAYDPFMRELILSTYHLSEKTARDYIEAIIKYNVKAIVGYPSAVSFLARICLSLGQSLSLKAVLTSSETLTALTRKTISTAFGCPVYDFYGSAERTCYVFTCEEGSYHIQPEYGYTELIPTDEAGQCKVVSTGFWNPAMPFIRYELGDIVVSSHEVCPCGRQFPVVREIMGRQADVIRTPSGRQFGAAILTHLLYGVDNIVESQIVQQAIDRITIKYVRGPSFSQQDLENLKRLVAKHLPQELAVDFEEVSSIEKTSSGKLKPVVSRISGYSSVC